MTSSTSKFETFFVIWFIMIYSKEVWDIFLKFSPLIHHMFVLIWWKKICRCSIKPARNGPFLPKFWTALATVIVGIFFRKKFWWGFRPISVAYQKEFWISWKKRRFQIFQKPSSPGFQSFLVNISAGIRLTLISHLFFYE